MDLTAAMKARRAAETGVLRALLAALDNAEAVPVGQAHDRHVVRAFGDPSAETPRLLLNEADVRRLLQREAAEREDAAIELERLGELDDAQRLRREASLVERYL